MAVRKEVAQELATLALAQAIAEASAPSARAALAAGANRDAFWIDGKTRLVDLAKARGSGARAGAGAKAVAALFSPEALRSLPSMKSDRARWSLDFVKFVAMRGYGFERRTAPRSGERGTELKGWKTARAAVQFIEEKWGLVEDASCNGDAWKLTFGAIWNGDKRIVGFTVRFWVPCDSWSLVEMFDQAAKKKGVLLWPDDTDPILSRQKVWEGMQSADSLYWGDAFSIDAAAAWLRRGGYPFAKVDGRFLGDQPHIKDKEAATFMNLIREEVGESDGWHIRIKPCLTAKGIAALREKARLQLATPSPASPKKSLKVRADIL